MERFVEPCLLLLLGQQTSHGYELMERLVASGLLTEEPDPGLIYRTLRRLEESGIVTSVWETGGAGPAKRQYTLNEAGHDYLAVWAGNVKSNRDRLDHFLSVYSQFSKDDGNGKEGRAMSDSKDKKQCGCGGHQHQHQQQKCGCQTHQEGHQHQHGECGCGTSKHNHEGCGCGQNKTEKGQEKE